MSWLNIQMQLGLWFYDNYQSKEDYVKVDKV